MVHGIVCESVLFFASWKNTNVYLFLRKMNVLLNWNDFFEGEHYFNSFFNIVNIFI